MSDTQLDIEKLTADVRRLEYSADDMIVITAPEHLRLRTADVEEIRALVESRFPGENKVMVLTGGLEIGVMHPTGDVTSPSA
jgi:hypothetical protein